MADSILEMIDTGSLWLGGSALALIAALIGIAVLDGDWPWYVGAAAAFVGSIVGWVLLWLKPWIED